MAYIVLNDLRWIGSPRSGSESVLGPVSFEIGQGEFFTILGSAASGNTRLLKIIAGLMVPATGEVLISGKKVDSPQTEIGFVFRDPALLPWRSVLTNVLLQAEVRGLNPRGAEGRARLLLASAGLSGCEDLRPQELPLYILPWVSICRALLHEPALVLMDDPFAVMDALSRETVTMIFQRLRDSSRATVLLATQNIAEAVQLSDRVAVMPAQPGQSVQIITIDLPRPRRLDKTTSPRLTEYCNRVRTLLQAQGVLP